MIVDNNGTIHVTWAIENRGGSWIYYNYKTSGGEWNSDEKVYEDTADSLSRNPSICAKEDGTVHIVWEEYSNSCYNILYEYRNTDGSWSSSEIISTESNSDSNFPIIMLDNEDTLHVVWFDDSNYSGVSIVTCETSERFKCNVLYAFRG